MQRCILTAVAAAGLTATAANADQTAATGRDILEKNGDAIVMIESLLQVNASGMMGMGPQESEETHEFIGISAGDGYFIAPLSSINPTLMMGSISMQGMDLSMEAEIRDIDVYKEDGSSAPAEIVLEDTDLDLAVIRLVDEADYGDFGSLNMARTAPAPQILQSVFSLSRGNETLNRRSLIRHTRVYGVLEQPRMLYLVESRPGAAIFDDDGKFIGICAMHYDPDASLEMGMMMGNESPGIPSIVHAKEIISFLEDARTE